MKRQRSVSWILLGMVTVLLLGSFLRLYRIRDTLMFQGDQGRDAIVAKRMIKDGKLTLLGPATSVGNMYLGPFYYYFMAPFLALTYPDPVGPAIGVALVSIATIWLIYWTGSQMLGKRAGFLASALYAVMPVAVFYGRFSWNPNVAPFFSLLLVYGMWKGITNAQWRWWWLSALAFGVLAQLHYVALLAAGVMGVGWLVGWFAYSKKRGQIVLHSLVMVGIVALTFVPLVLFDFRHDHLIWQAFVDFFSGPKHYFQPMEKLSIVMAETQGRSFRIMAQLMGSPNGIADRIITYTSLALLVLAWRIGAITSKERLGLFLVVSWIVTAIVGTSLYSSGIFDHYLAFVFPAIVLLFGWLADFIARSGWMGKGAVAVLLVGYFSFGLMRSPAFAQAGTGIDDYKRVAEAVFPYISGEPYNIAMVAQNRDYKAMNYRYFFEITPTPPQSIDVYTNLKQLVIIDENKTTSPLDVPIYEIQTPGLTSITQTLYLPHEVVVYIVE